MADKCVICGKSAPKYVSNPSHPGKKVCVNCLNGLVFNAGTLNEAMEPITSAFNKALKDIKEGMEK